MRPDGLTWVLADKLMDDGRSDGRFVCNRSASTLFYAVSIVGGVRCVYETVTASSGVEAGGQTGGWTKDGRTDARTSGWAGGRTDVIWRVIARSFKFAAGRTHVAIGGQADG